MIERTTQVSLWLADVRAVEELTTILSREREQLETLLFRLEQEQLLLSNGRTRWLGRAAHDVENAIDDIRSTELLRAAAADAAAAQHGLKPSPSMSELIIASSEPWTTILTELRDSFLALTQEMTTLAETNRELITAGYRSARETLLWMDGDAPSYGADGAVVAAAPRSQLLDRSL